MTDHDKGDVNRLNSKPPRDAFYSGGATNALGFFLLLLALVFWELC